MMGTFSSLQSCHAARHHPVRQGAADIELHTDIPTDAWASCGVPQRLQCEGDLGLKMFQALDRALNQGRERALILGSDSPTLPPSHVVALLSSTADVAIGPTEDGGYYAVSCRAVHLDMFAGVAWSASSASRTRSGLSGSAAYAWKPDRRGGMPTRPPTLPRHS
jgi:Uncharacterized protein conserved in bacteria (DUF2064)